MNHPAPSAVQSNTGCVEQPLSFKYITLQYMEATNPDQRLDVVHKLEIQGSDIALRRAGEMCLEIASAQPDTLTQTALLDRAVCNWSTLLENKAYLPTASDALSTKASAYIIALPLFRQLFPEQRVPDIDTSESVYRQLVALTSHTEKGLERAGSNKYFSKEARLIGAIQELNVLLILQRFGLRELDDKSWLAVPSFLSEDYSINSPDTPIKDPWDVSVFTQYNDNDPPKLTYKIQVKNKRPKAAIEDTDKTTKPNINNDVCLINVLNDLSTNERYKTLSVATIGRICRAELEDPTNITTRDFLDTITEQLLERLG